MEALCDRLEEEELVERTGGCTLLTGEVTLEGGRLGGRDGARVGVPGVTSKLHQRTTSKE